MYGYFGVYGESDMGAVAEMGAPVWRRRRGRKYVAEILHGDDPRRAQRMDREYVAEVIRGDEDREPGDMGFYGYYGAPKGKKAKIQSNLQRTLVYLKGQQKKARDSYLKTTYDKLIKTVNAAMSGKMAEARAADEESEESEDLSGIMEMAQTKVLGVPAWGLALAGVAALAYTGKIKIPGLGAKKRNPRRRRKHSRRHNRR